MCICQSERCTLQHMHMYTQTHNTNSHGTGPSPTTAPPYSPISYPCKWSHMLCWTQSSLRWLMLSMCPATWVPAQELWNGNHIHDFQHFHQNNNHIQVDKHTHKILQVERPSRIMMCMKQNYLQLLNHFITCSHMHQHGEISLCPHHSMYTCTTGSMQHICTMEPSP